MNTSSGELSMLPAAVKRWLHKPKRSDPHPLAQFFYADKEVTRVMTELNNVNLHNDPQEYVLQLNNLRARQDHMLQIINQIMDECIPNERPNREFQVKFPDEVLQEQLGVQLWFAAECLMASSLIEVHESEMFLLRPLAEELLHSLEEVRSLLREQCFSDYTVYTDDIKASLVRFDRLFAEFEFSYVSAVVPIKSPEELFNQQQIIVLFCETIDRALKLGYLTQEMIDGLEPVLMFTIPRLAIICGLIIYPEGPLNLEQQPDDMSRLFKPFYALLQKIRDLLYVLTEEELSLLEKSLCAVESEDFFNPHTMFPNVSSPLHNTTLHHEMLDEPTHAGGGSPIRHDREEHGHRAPNEPYCYQSTSNASNSVKQTSNEIQHLLEGSNFILDRDDEMWGQEFGWIVNVSTQEDAQNENKIIYTDSPRLSLSTSNDSLTDSNSMQCYCVAINNPHSGTDHPEFLDGLEMAGVSTIATIQAPNSPDECHVPTTSEQDHVSHLNADCPDELTENHKPEAASFLGAIAQQNICGRSVSNNLVPEDLHTNNSRLSEGKNESHVMDWKMKRQAVQAVNAVVREEIRSRYRNSGDMLHRLFVCISGVADQLQTNFAGDLRRILKTVFEIATSTPEKEDVVEEEEEEHVNAEPPLEDCALCQESHSHSSRTSNLNSSKPEVPPEWIADSACNQCMSCKAPFTIIRRRHHCRNCGKIFCSRCSSQSAPLPWYGQMKPVRVCSHCYLCHLTSYYSSTSAC
ncbi:lateral signaling target protein 2 homolog [Pristis pectinata]|uniref:lateral signaling target protein 2 homolog n=1 Tax=Pristis pectinata TaxID=685728 RepID=UPI00223D8741|nr:lateral signaling target protein 2 homolog [Pristis pectinata]